jgi:hypothetical protein
VISRRSVSIWVRQFDLQRALARCRPFPEDVQDQARPVDDLAAPGAFQVALLDRGQRGIDNGDRHLVLGQRTGLARDLPVPQQGGRSAHAQREDGGMYDDQADGGRKADRLGQLCLGRAGVIDCPLTGCVGTLPRQDHRGPDRSVAGLLRSLSAPCVGVVNLHRRQGSFPSQHQQFLQPGHHRTVESVPQA